MKTVSMSFVSEIKLSGKSNLLIRKKAQNMRARRVFIFDRLTAKTMKLLLANVKLLLKYSTSCCEAIVKFNRKLNLLFVRIGAEIISTNFHDIQRQT